MLTEPKHNHRDIPSDKILSSAVQYARSDQGKAQIKTAGDLQNFIDLVTVVWDETFFSDAEGPKTGNAYRRIISEAKTPAEKAAAIRSRSTKMQSDMLGTNLIGEGLSDFWLGAMGSSLPGNYSPRPSRTFKFGSVFTEENINKISTHLSQFGENPENDIMIGRMKDISAGKLRPTKIDYNFVAHELREQQLMSQGMKYQPAHEQTLREQGMYHPDYDKKLYTPEALKASDHN